MKAEAKKTTFKNVYLRTVSGVILIPIVLLILWQGGMAFKALLIMAAVLMAYEWNSITQKKVPAVEEKPSPKIKKSFNMWPFIGLFYITLPVLSLMWLRDHPKGVAIILWIFGLVWATDSGAYFAGSLFGGPKLAPKISPSKTWSGLAGGICMALIVTTGIFKYLHLPLTKSILILTFVLACYAQIGDLLESWLKRHFGVKDSGSLIPGHGGILDRVDGIIMVAPKVALFILIEGGRIF